MEKEIVISIHKAYRWVVAICDKELAGQKLEEGEKQLDLSGQFFKGDERSREEAAEIIKDCVREDATFNIVGEKSCALAKELGIIQDDGISYALVLL